MEELIAQYLIDTDYFNQDDIIEEIEQTTRYHKICYLVKFETFGSDFCYVYLEDLLVYLFNRTGGSNQTPLISLKEK